mmetsp:Transcript_56674/g.135316  ORF Transcript_56674/g.135316 Transcript_56674/m.135316 type:complete len:203 (-) Transcript_56674:877-1485(-)
MAPSSAEAGLSLDSPHSSTRAARRAERARLPAASTRPATRTRQPLDTALEVLGSERGPVKLLLRERAPRDLGLEAVSVVRLATWCRRNGRPVKPHVVRRLQHRGLLLREVLVEGLGPPPRVLRVGAAVRHRRRREPDQAQPPLVLQVPRRRPVDGALREEDDIPRLGLRLIQAPIQVIMPIDQHPRRREVRLVRPPDAHEPP